MTDKRQILFSEHRGFIQKLLNSRMLGVFPKLPKVFPCNFLLNSPSELLSMYTIWAMSENRLHEFELIIFQCKVIKMTRDHLKCNLLTVNTNSLF